jgi:lysophospholipase L1-like esterase
MNQPQSHRRYLAARASVAIAAAFLPLGACTGNSGSQGTAAPDASETDAAIDTDGTAGSGSGGGGSGSSGSAASGSSSGGSGATSGAGSGSTSGSGSQDAAAPSNVAIHFLGRFDTRDAAGPRFAWPGSAIAVSFQGTGLQVGLSDLTPSGTCYFAVSVDGQAPTVLPTSGTGKTYTLASGLSAGMHMVVLTKKTEAQWGVMQLLAVTPTGANAALVASPNPFSRRIEYVGDSITTGFGDIGVGPNCSISADTEDETVAYGALTAANLNAQQTVIAYQGKGMYRDNQNATTNQMPTLFERTLPNDDMSIWGFTTPSPDVVLINLGSNDFSMGDPGQAFVTAYVDFLHKLRGHYPMAQIVCAQGPLIDGANRTTEAVDIENAVRQLHVAGDTRVQTLQITEDDGGTAFGFDEQVSSDGFGCAYHPSTKTHQIMAAKLTPVLKALLGW